MQKDIKRMNEHLNRVHQTSPLTREEFEALTRVSASKSGPHNSFREPPSSSSEEEDDFRSESDFEARLGLLQSSLVISHGEIVSVPTESPFFDHGSGVNPYLKSTLELFERAHALCRRAGCTLVRQQAARNFEGKVTCKGFQPVTLKTAERYASNVAKFVYFCSKIEWDVTGCWEPKYALECLLSVLFERNRTISQTFITR